MGVHTLNASEFINELEKQSDLLIVDLRTHAEVASECLHNCIHLPLQELNYERLHQHINAKGLSAESHIYLLCQSGRRASMAVEKLGSDHDFSLVILDGGLNALKQAGANTIRGARSVISLERQVRIAAGLLVLLGVALGFLLNSYFFFLSAFVGAGLTFAGITDTCGMAMMLARMPWNKA